jgi:hypothetical protein
MNIKHMPKKKRRLWLEVTAKGVTVPREQYIQTLIESVEGGKPYKLPSEWVVTLKWSNEEGAELKEGIWSKVLKDSAKVSPGFDLAVAAWLKRKL